MERVYCLYRVSTERQADENNEIQMQQIVCWDYARQQGWCIVKKISEVGISGFKTETAEREGIQSILEEHAQGSLIFVWFICSIELGVGQERCASLSRSYEISEFVFTASTWENSITVTEANL